MTISTMDTAPAHRRRSRVSLAHPRRTSATHLANLVAATSNANPVSGNHAVTSNLGTGNGNNNSSDSRRRHSAAIHGLSSMDSGHHHAGPPPTRTQSSTNLTKQRAHHTHHKRVASASNLTSTRSHRAPLKGSESKYSIDSVGSGDSVARHDDERARVVGEARRSGSTLGTTPSDHESFSSIAFGGNKITPLTVIPPSTVMPTNSSSTASATSPTAALPISASSTSQPQSVNSTAGALAPPSSPASPPMQVPSSVVLPKQPNPTPADGFFLNRTHSSYNRPHSPPMHAQQQQLAVGGIASSSGSSSTASSSAVMMRQRSAGQSAKSVSTKRPSALSGANGGRRTSDRKVRLDAPSSTDNAAPVKRASSAKQLTTADAIETAHSASDARIAPAAAATGRKPSDQRVQAKWPAAPSTARRTAPTAPAAPVAVPAVTSAKKSKFFIQSPSTDSDDEVFSRSLQLRADAAAAAGKAKLSGQQRTSPLQQQDLAQQRVVIPAAHGQALHSRPVPPSVRVAHASNDGAQEYEDAEDDDDDGDWSSETSSSSEADSGDIDRGLASAAAQRAKAAQTEAERQRLMFAKRTPSQVNVVKSNLSELLAQQRTAQTLQQDMQRAHAQHLMAKSSGISAALGAHAGNGGLHGSKSAAALPTVAANERRPGQLRTTASGAGLTRLGAMPSGIELDSSDESDVEQDNALLKSKLLNGNAKANGQLGSSPQSGSSSVDQQISSTRIAALMDRRRLSNGAQAVHPSPSPMSGIAPPVFTGDHIFTPTTTRRAMLADELTHSLRLNLVTERATRAGGMAGIMNRISRAASQVNITTSEPGTSPFQTRTQHGDANFAHGQTGNGNAAINHDSNFEYPHQQSKKSSRAPAFHTVADAGCEYQLPPRPSPPSRASSEPEAANYYSAGFHHVGW